MSEDNGQNDATLADFLQYSKENSLWPVVLDALGKTIYIKVLTGADLLQYQEMAEKGSDDIDFIVKSLCNASGKRLFKDRKQYLRIPAHLLLKIATEFRAINNLNPESLVKN
jgi:hypothetical protein